MGKYPMVWTYAIIVMFLRVYALTIFLLAPRRTTILTCIQRVETFLVFLVE